jgi:YVTN family beta-propeller protein
MKTANSVSNSVVFCVLLLMVACVSVRGQTALSRDGGRRTNQTCLPTGVCLDPAGRSFDVGNMPLAIVRSPEGDRLVVSLSGWRQQGIQVIDPQRGMVVQTIPQPGAFLGLAFSNDGRTLYASGGNEDVIYRYAWRDKQAMLVDSIVLAPKKPKEDGTRFPAGIAVSHDDKYLFVAENVADTLAVIDLQTRQVVQRLRTDSYPYAVVISPADEIYVSAWGGQTVSVFMTEQKRSWKELGKIIVGRHPSALLLNRDGSRLFVASASTNSIVVVDTKQARVLTRLLDPPPAGPNQGSTPNALALSQDGLRLYVAEADNNAVAVFQLSTEIAGIANARGANRLIGRIPVGWYPAALLLTQDSLFILNGKGKGTRANPHFSTPDVELPDDSVDYTLGQLNGTITTLPVSIKPAEMTQLTQRVARANNWNSTPTNGRYPPFKHVIYIIKENRTYDQVFGDLSQANGDPSLVFFPRAVSPNHHALAERFGLFDRFFCNAEVSSQGHVWSTAAYVTDYGEKTIPSLYSSRRDPNDRDDVDEPASGYLWNAALRKGVTLRNYGEFGEPVPKSQPARYRAIKPALDRYTSREYPSFDMKISDQVRANVWLKEFREFVRQGNLPALEIMHLPGDHTAGGRPGRPTPKACMADNDLALGRIVEAVSNSPYWKDTVFFVLEDDAQDGPDHVDSHRSVLLVISAYNRGAVIHRFVNTTDILATVEEILGLDKLSKFDYYGHPLRDIFNATPDLTPYVALKSAQPLNELNPAKGTGAQASLKLDLDRVDAADEDAFNRILWSVLKGPQPYPGTKRMSSLEVARAR